MGNINGNMLLFVPSFCFSQVYIFLWSVTSMCVKKNPDRKISCNWHFLIMARSSEQNIFHFTLETFCTSTGYVKVFMRCKKVHGNAVWENHKNFTKDSYIWSLQFPLIKVVVKVAQTSPRSHRIDTSDISFNHIGAIKKPLNNSKG